MKLQNLPVTVVIIVFVLIIGCTSTSPTSPQIVVTPSTEQTTITIPTNSPSIATTSQVAICDEWFSCGFGFGNFQGEPAGLSQRCHELYEMRMQNDQRVMSCLKNPYEASGNNAVVKLHCMQGVGTVEECAKYGIKLDRDNGNVIN
jgi:hypothetical protein